MNNSENLMPKTDHHDYLRRRISPDEKFAKLLEFPRFLEIETVNTCNARCPMCTIDEWTRNSPTMKDGLFNKIAEEISAFAPALKRVSLYRDGEPLLDKKLPDRVATLKENGVKTVSIATNVSLLNEERANNLLHAGIDHIIFSIDSLNKDVFEAIRVRLNFEEVMENALRFIELRNKIRPETQIVVRMIRQDSNQDEWPEYKAFWDKKVSPVDRVYYHNIHNWGTQLENFVPIEKSYEPQLPCVALWSLLVIFANGDVPLCNVDYNNEYPTGSVLDDSIQNLWRSKIMTARRGLHTSGQKDKIGHCVNCNVWDEPDKGNGLVSADFAEQIELAG